MKGRQASSLTLPVSILARLFSHPNDRYANQAMGEQSRISSQMHNRDTDGDSVAKNRVNT